MAHEQPPSYCYLCFPDGRGHRHLAGVCAGVIGNMVAMLGAALVNTVWQGVNGVLA